MEALDSAWVLLGEILQDVREDLRESCQWSVKFAEWEWKSVLRLVCYPQNKRNS